MCDSNMAKIQTHSHFGTNKDSCEGNGHDVERVPVKGYSKKRCNDCEIVGQCTS